MLDALIVFLAFIALDVAYAWYTQAIARHQVCRASVWAGVIPVLSAVVVIHYVDNNWLVIPAAVGAAVGTYIAMRITDADHS